MMIDSFQKRSTPSAPSRDSGYEYGDGDGDGDDESINNGSNSNKISSRSCISTQGPWPYYQQIPPEFIHLVRLRSRSPVTFEANANAQREQKQRQRYERHVINEETLRLDSRGPRETEIGIGTGIFQPLPPVDFGPLDWYTQRDSEREHEHELEHEIKRPETPSEPLRSRADAAVTGNVPKVCKQIPHHASGYATGGGPARLVSDTGQVDIATGADRAASRRKGAQNTVEIGRTTTPAPAVQPSPLKRSGARRRRNTHVPVSERLDGDRRGSLETDTFRIVCREDGYLQTTPQKRAQTWGVIQNHQPLEDSAAPLPPRAHHGSEQTQRCREHQKAHDSEYTHHQQQHYHPPQKPEEDPGGEENEQSVPGAEALALAYSILGPLRTAHTVQILLQIQGRAMRRKEWEMVRCVLEGSEKARVDLRVLALGLEGMDQG